MADKEFFITSIPMIEVVGSTNIPTVLHYETKGHVLIGSEAKAAAHVKGRHALNEDFKIDLGNHDPSLGKAKQLFTTATGEKISAGELTGEFVTQLLRYVNDWLRDRNAEYSSIVVAEPLPMQDTEIDDKWLANYRSALRRILLGKGFTKENIDFMPEPFAVFQYYKYGVKHPVLTGTNKQIALVIDFGGGSFDVCIIETDKEGDITGKRKNTKPCGASSAPVGGYYVNRKLAEALFFKYFETDKSKLKKGIALYEEWRRTGKGLATCAPEYAAFVRNFHESIYIIEEPKVSLCRLVQDWGLETSLGQLTVPVRFFKNPFSNESEYFNAQLNGAEIRDVFKQIWREKLAPKVRQSLKRGMEDLGGAPISVVLLSGGSCNIGWLKGLLEHDFSEELRNAQILPLQDDFQEVVAKGLAIECARRFYDEAKAGDFSAVTYNGLHLVLNPDEKGFQLKLFSPDKGNPLLPSNKPCVLLPSASFLAEHFDKPLTWRVRLDRPPHNCLDYYFMCAGFNPFKEGDHGNKVASEGPLQEEEPGDTSSDIALYSDDLLNIEQHRLYSPANCTFDRYILAELTIGKENKTARARFIYRTGRADQESIAVETRPFYLHMTDTQDNPRATAYLGFDFGTSNTQVSYVNQIAIKAYEKRLTEHGWSDLSQLSRTLPYPMAIPLSRYVCEYEPSKSIQTAREFTEAALTMAAYITYLEMCVNKGRGQTKVFGGFTQRSVGPLWRLLRDALNQVGKDTKFCNHYRELIQVHLGEIDQAVTFFGQHKHEKESAGAFNPRVVTILANVNEKVFSEFKFGYFENVHQERFKLGEYRGHFRVACGASTNFVDSIDYKGSVGFPNNVPYLLDVVTRQALPLHPLLFWYRCERHPDDEHFFFYDKPEQRSKPFESFSYKAAGYPCSCVVSQSKDELGTLAGDIIGFTDADPTLRLVPF